MSTTTTDQAQLAGLKHQHNEYIERLRAKGVTLLAYKVPCCGAELEDRANMQGGRWTSLATCPDCGGMYMKITTATKIEALVPPAE